MAHQKKEDGEITGFRKAAEAAYRGEKGMLKKHPYEKI
jgi:hypothetical protein